jgi:NAD(P)H-hydrate repair Nnr-like enzyme with NAD(P)H-hydrate dehydratase domain
MSGPIGVDDALLAGWRPPAIPDDSDKELRGRVMVLAGGAQVAGATLLTATAALRAGAGKLKIAAPASLAPGRRREMVLRTYNFVAPLEERGAPVTREPDAKVVAPGA